MQIMALNNNAQDVLQICVEELLSSIDPKLLKP